MSHSNTRFYQNNNYQKNCRGNETDVLARIKRVEQKTEKDDFEICRQINCQRNERHSRQPPRQSQRQNINRHKKQNSLPSFHANILTQLTLFSATFCA